MTADPRAALAILTSSLERHLEAAASSRGENDPAVVAAYQDVAEAFDAYDDALLEAYDEVTPLEIYGGDDDDDDDDDFDDDDDEDDELDEPDDEDDDGVYLGWTTSEYDAEDGDDASRSEGSTDGSTPTAPRAGSEDRPAGRQARWSGVRETSSRADTARPGSSTSSTASAAAQLRRGAGAHDRRRRTPGRSRTHASATSAGEQPEPVGGGDHGVHHLRASRRPGTAPRSRTVLAGRRPRVGRRPVAVLAR